MSTVNPSLVPVFPQCPGYGITSQPKYLVNQVRREGGAERSDRRWARPLSWYTAVPVGDRDDDVIQSILHFWHAMGGRLNSFLFKDWADYKTCFVSQDPQATDGLLSPITLDDSSTGYRLLKRYVVNSVVQLREIVSPVGSTMLVANEDGDEQDDWIVDENSGILVPGDGFTGTPTTWGGEFNVLVRFDSELTVHVADSKIQSVDFTLCEKRLPLSFHFESGAVHGIIWDSPISTSPQDFVSLVYGDGAIVGIDSGGDVYQSTDDGASWTQTQTGFSPACMAFGNGVFMMGNNGHVMTSSDGGATWGSAVALPGGITNVRSICCGSGSNWVLIDDHVAPARYAKSSDDGATWIAPGGTTIGIFAADTRIQYNPNDSTFVALGKDAGFVESVLVSSDNGATWAATNMSYPDGSTFDGGNGACGFFFDGTNFILGIDRFSSDGNPPGIRIASTGAGLATATTQDIPQLPFPDNILPRIILAVEDETFIMGDNAGVINSTDQVTWVAGDMGLGGGTTLGKQSSGTVDTDNNIAFVSIVGSQELAKYTHP